MVELKPGESIEVSGSTGNAYVITNHDGHYSCTCLAWKRQKIPATHRTCKHIKELRGDIAESRRVPAPPDPSACLPLPRVLTDAAEIIDAIESLCGFERLWVDTEVADWKSGNGRLSLIQVLADGVEPHTGEVLFFDVLDRPDIARVFVERIMTEASIEKVFHNAPFDLRYLGDEETTNVFCTYKSARTLASSGAPLPNRLTLKALSEHFGLAERVSKREQTSDWGRRPLTERQLKYAALDVVYLRGVHLGLLGLRDSLEDPAEVDIAEIEGRLLEIEPEYQRLKAVHEHLRDLLKRAMDTQRVDASEHFSISRSEWQPMDVSIAALAALVMEHGLDSDVTTRISRATLAALGPIADELESVARVQKRVVLRRRMPRGDRE
jgi:ribonuclease D